MSRVTVRRRLVACAAPFLVAASLVPRLHGAELLAHYTFNEGRGAVVRDRSGAGRSGQNRGATYVPSPRGYALRFDGIDDQVSYAGSAGFGLRGGFTLAIWLISSEHGRQLWPDIRALVLATLIAAGLAAFFTVPLGPASVPAGTLLSGPYYLYGIQGALLDLPQELGWIVPALLVLLYGLTRHVHDRTRLILSAGLALILAAYLAMSLRILLKTLW